MATEAKQPKNILIVRLSAMGDILLGLPTLAALTRAFPNARIDWVCEDKTAQLLHHNPNLTRLIIFPRQALAHDWSRPWRWPLALIRLVRFLLQLRQNKYDALLDLQGNLKSALQVFFARADRKIGFGKEGTREGAWLVLNEKIDPGPPTCHRIEKDLRLAGALNQQTAYTRPALGLRTEDLQAATEFWHQPTGSGPRITIHPGSSAYNAYKRWPAARYALVIQQLKVELDARIAVIEGPGEEEIIQKIKATGTAFTLIPKTLNLLAVAARIGTGDLFLGGDSAPLHLASLQGIPCTAIFGPKSPDRFGPYKVPARILRYPTPCHPCRLRSCPTPLCVKCVQASEVTAALSALWAETKNSRTT